MLKRILLQMIPILKKIFIVHFLISAYVYATTDPVTNCQPSVRDFMKKGMLVHAGNLVYDAVEKKLQITPMYPSTYWTLNAVVPNECFFTGSRSYSCIVLTPLEKRVNSIISICAQEAIIPGPVNVETGDIVYIHGMILSGQKNYLENRGIKVIEGNHEQEMTLELANQTVEKILRNHNRWVFRHEQIPSYASWTHNTAFFADSGTRITNQRAFFDKLLNHYPHISFGYDLYSVGNGIASSYRVFSFLPENSSDKFFNQLNMFLKQILESYCKRHHNLECRAGLSRKIDRPQDADDRSERLIYILEKTLQMSPGIFSEFVQLVESRDLLNDFNLYSKEWEIIKDTYDFTDSIRNRMLVQKSGETIYSSLPFFAKKVVFWYATNATQDIQKGVMKLPGMPAHHREKENYESRFLREWFKAPYSDLTDESKLLAYDLTGKNDPTVLSMLKNTLTNLLSLLGDYYDSYQSLEDYCEYTYPRI